MPRRKPASAKQRKAELQLKRAVKRGDAEATSIAAEQAAERRKKRHTKGRVPVGTTKPGQSLNKGSAGGSGVSTKHLESRFIKLDKAWLENARLVASTTTLVRPIPENMQILDIDGFARHGDAGGGSMELMLNAPRRPKWRYDQSKKEVEKNEEGVFLKWIRDTDAVVEKWQTPIASQSAEPEEGKDTTTKDSDDEVVFKRSPTWFERNLEVWRQLWRVTEISQILLILLDSRAPTLHFPPSMQQYIQSIRPAPQLVLVLTKVDLITPTRARAWTEYLTAQHPTARIVQVESYKEREGVLNDGRAGKQFLDPHIPPAFLAQLVEALKGAYASLLTPPPNAKAHWKPRVREGIDWDRISAEQPPNHGERVDATAFTAEASEPSTTPVTGSSNDKIRLSPHESADGTAPDGEQEEHFITIGLIGQPNVGKSSLLNALFGTKRVRASRTPGKTKHFQTFFWTPEIRLVDCPGLVFPGLVPMELQVLAGVLPISQMASIPSCVQFICERMPLERVLGLERPGGVKPAEDKRTWRAGMKNVTEERNLSKWTAMDVLTAHATRNGWLTAKAGRPDVQRAGNALLRACADGRNIRWGFRPPDTQQVHDEIVIEDGIWIRGGHTDGPKHWDDADESGEEEDATEDDGGESPSSDANTEDTDEEDSQDGGTAFAVAGRFGALSLVDNDESSEDS